MSTSDRRERQNRREHDRSSRALHRPVVATKVGGVKSRGDLAEVLCASREVCGGQSTACFETIIQSTAMVTVNDGSPVSYTHLTLPTSGLVEIPVVAVYLKKKKT